MVQHRGPEVPLHPIDAVRLDFDAAGLATLNVVLALVMFGVALDLKVQDLRDVLASPRAPLVGLACQVFGLPALTFAVSSLLPIPASMKLGLVLVAACPGGNVSNYLTQISGGRVATSVGMTAVSTLAALVVTPANVSFWGGLGTDTAALLTTVALDPWAMGRTLALLIALPVVVGVGVGERLPGVAAWLRTPMRVGSLVFLVAFIGIAFSKNLGPFLSWVHLVFFPVALMNAIALSLGYTAAAGAGLDEADRRAVSMEVGIQNAGLGLVLVFGAFDGLGGMAVVCGWWGIWHIISGLTLAGWWRWRDSRR